MQQQCGPMPSQRALSMPSLIIHKMLVKYEFVVRCASKMFLINIYVWLELNYDCYLHLNERPNNYYFTFNVVVRPKKLSVFPYSSQSELFIYLTAIPSQILYHNLFTQTQYFCALAVYISVFRMGTQLPLSRKEWASSVWVRYKVTERERERANHRNYLLRQNEHRVMGEGRLFKFQTTEYRRIQICQSSL